MTTPPDPKNPTDPDHVDPPQSAANPDHATGLEHEIPGKDAGADELEDNITHTREQLGETTEALAEKFDVKAQAKHTMQDAKQQVTQQADAARARGEHTAERVKEAATDQQGKPKPAVVAAVVLIAAGSVVAAIMISRRRH